MFIKEYSKSIILFVYFQDYANKLRKAERTLEARAQRGGSASKRGKSHKSGSIFVPSLIVFENLEDLINAALAHAQMRHQ